MFSDTLKEYLQTELQKLTAEGLLKTERALVTPQGPEVGIGIFPGAPRQSVLNFCANNYLGLADHRVLLDAARESLDTRGLGLASVRFICGTQDLHLRLERRIAEFLGMEAAILHSSCFDANLGVFEALFDEPDVIISDALNHASLISGIRLSRAARKVYEHSSMTELEARLKEAQDARFRVIVTDGVFSMDGDIARLREICDLADRYGSLVLVDDSHATGFIGPEGRGTPELSGVMNRVDIITTTFGKALGGASGGCIAARKSIIDILRQRSRPYLFSNTLAPAIVAATLAALDLLRNSDKPRARLFANTRQMRSGLTAAGFRIQPGETPIVPILLGHIENDARVAVDFAARLLAEGIYVVGFSFPVVPRGAARIRVQLSAAHTEEQIEFALGKFTQVGKELAII